MRFSIDIRIGPLRLDVALGPEQRPQGTLEVAFTGEQRPPRGTLEEARLRHEQARARLAEIEVEEEELALEMNRRVSRRPARVDRAVRDVAAIRDAVSARPAAEAGEATPEG